MINFSDLMWKSSQRREHKSVAASFAESREFEFNSELREIPAKITTSSPDGRVALLLDPESATAERLRYVQMRLCELRTLAKLQTIAITSPLPQDGKSTIAICLATALAEGGKRRVLLIEADLHRPSVAKTLSIPQSPGVAECLEKDLDPVLALRKLEPMGWYLLQAGKSSNPVGLLKPESCQSLIRRLSMYFDWILIDTPPALPVTDAFTVSRCVDATLLVARADQTSRTAVEETLKLIGRKHVVGMILNGTEQLTKLYSGGYGY